MLSIKVTSLRASLVNISCIFSNSQSLSRPPCLCLHCSVAPAGHRMRAAAGLHLRRSLRRLVVGHHRHRAGRRRPAPVRPPSNESAFQNPSVSLKPSTFLPFQIARFVLQGLINTPPPLLTVAGGGAEALGSLFLSGLSAEGEK